MQRGDRRGSVARIAWICLIQRGFNPVEPRHAHVDDQGAGEAGQGRPVDRGLGLLGVFVAGDERDGRGGVAVGDVEQDALVACPDPDERLIMRIERIGERTLVTEELT